MKCPRCDAQVPAKTDASGFYTCAACGAKLRSKAVPKPEPPEPRPEAAETTPEAAETTPEPPEPKPEQPGPRPEPPEPSPNDALLARSESRSLLGTNPNLTLPPGTPLPRIPRAESRDLSELLTELRAVRAMQQEILSILKEIRLRPAPPTTGDPESLEPPEMDPDASLTEGEPEPEDDSGMFLTEPVRSRRRKSVLLIDDEVRARNAAVAALEQADIPVRATGDGNGGIAAVAAEKPDVIVIDLGLGGSFPAKDVINVIKATMEWVDIPIVLYTGAFVTSQKEARTIHGADEYVPKGAGPEALVAKVIALFRKG